MSCYHHEWEARKCAFFPKISTFSPYFFHHTKLLNFDYSGVSELKFIFPCLFFPAFSGSIWPLQSCYWCRNRRNRTEEKASGVGLCTYQSRPPWYQHCESRHLRIVSYNSEDWNHSNTLNSHFSEGRPNHCKIDNAGFPGGVWIIFQQLVDQIEVQLWLYKCRLFSTLTTTNIKWETEHSRLPGHASIR